MGYIQNLNTRETSVDDAIEGKTKKPCYHKESGVIWYNDRDSGEEYRECPAPWGNKGVA